MWYAVRGMGLPTGGMGSRRDRDDGGGGCRRWAATVPRRCRRWEAPSGRRNGRRRYGDGDGGPPGSSSSDAEKQANLALLETDASRPATMDAVKSAVFTQPPALTAEERKQRLLDSAEGRSARPEVPSTSVASSSPLPVVMATAVAEAAAGMATMDISDAPPALTAEERKQRILDQLHPLPQS